MIFTSGMNGSVCAVSLYIALAYRLVKKRHQVRCK